MRVCEGEGIRGGKRGWWLGLIQFVLIGGGVPPSCRRLMLGVAVLLLLAIYPLWGGGVLQRLRRALVNTSGCTHWCWAFRNILFVWLVPGHWVKVLLRGRDAKGQKQHL